MRTWTEEELEEMMDISYDSTQKTNADKIRAMNDKELGEFLERFGTFNRPCSLAPGEPLKWLQLEVEEKE